MISPPLTRLTPLLLIALLLAVIWALIGQRAALQDKVDQQRTDISGLSARLQHASQALHDVDTAHARLREEMASAESRLASRAASLEKLKHENAALRAWVDTALPADVIRLRERPELAGATAYREWLSARDGVSAAGEPANTKWPVAQ